MILASSIGTAAVASEMRSTTLTGGCSRGSSETYGSTVPAVSAGCAVTTFGRTVTMPASVVKRLAW